MMRFRDLVTVFLACVILNATICGAATVADQKPKVLLVSMDGFRWDYLFMADQTPSFDEMLQTGVKVPYMNSAFITNTYPNHYTLATGLYTESHGIVGNSMYDPELDEYFDKRSTESYWWDAGEPIWITAVKAGLKAGVYFWPGSEAEVQGLRPDIWKAYDGDVPYEERVENVISWLSRDDFDLCLLYFDEPDTSGHEFGPEDERMVPVIERMDGILGLILQKLKDAGLEDIVNLIVVSDHGMTPTDTDNQVVDLSEYMDDTILKQAVDVWSTAQLQPQPNMANELVAALSGIDHIHAMLKEDIPERFHLKNNVRVMDVFVYADEGWIMTTDIDYTRSSNLKGGHGYDKSLDSMKPIFFARGPAFKKNAEAPAIDNVDIYPLICSLLGLEPAPNNGSLSRASALLNEGDGNSGYVVTSNACVLLALAYLSVIFASFVK